MEIQVFNERGDETRRESKKEKKSWHVTHPKNATPFMFSTEPLMFFNRRHRENNVQHRQLEVSERQVQLCVWFWEIKCKA